MKNLHREQDDESKLVRVPCPTTAPPLVPSDAPSSLELFPSQGRTFVVPRKPLQVELGCSTFPPGHKLLFEALTLEPGLHAPRVCARLSNYYSGDTRTALAPLAAQEAQHKNFEPPAAVSSQVVGDDDTGRDEPEQLVLASSTSKADTKKSCSENTDRVFLNADNLHSAQSPFHISSLPRCFITPEDLTKWNKFFAQTDNAEGGGCRGMKAGKTSASSLGSCDAGAVLDQVQVQSAIFDDPALQIANPQPVWSGKTKLREVEPAEVGNKHHDSGTIVPQQQPHAQRERRVTTRNPDHTARRIFKSIGSFEASTKMHVESAVFYSMVWHLFWFRCRREAGDLKTGGKSIRKNNFLQQGKHKQSHNKPTWTKVEKGKARGGGAPGVCLFFDEVNDGVTLSFQRDLSHPEGVALPGSNPMNPNNEPEIVGRAKVVDLINFHYYRNAKTSPLVGGSKGVESKRVVVPPAPGLMQTDDSEDAKFVEHFYSKLLTDVVGEYLTEIKEDDRAETQQSKLAPTLPSWAETLYPSWALNMVYEERRPVSSTSCPGRSGNNIKGTTTSFGFRENGIPYITFQADVKELYRKDASLLLRKEGRMAANAHFRQARKEEKEARCTAAIMINLRRGQHRGVSSTPSWGETHMYPPKWDEDADEEAEITNNSTTSMGEQQVSSSYGTNYCRTPAWAAPEYNYRAGRLSARRSEQGRAYDDTPRTCYWAAHNEVKPPYIDPADCDHALFAPTSCFERQEADFLPFTEADFVPLVSTGGATGEGGGPPGCTTASELLHHNRRLPEDQDVDCHGRNYDSGAGAAPEFSSSCSATRKARRNEFQTTRAQRGARFLQNYYGEGGSAPQHKSRNARQVWQQDVDEQPLPRHDTTRNQDLPSPRCAGAPPGLFSRGFYAAGTCSSNRDFIHTHQDDRQESAHLRTPSMQQNGDVIWNDQEPPSTPLSFRRRETITADPVNKSVASAQTEPADGSLPVRRSGLTQPGDGLPAQSSCGPEGEVQQHEDQQRQHKCCSHVPERTTAASVPYVPSAAAFSSQPVVSSAFLPGRRESFGSYYVPATEAGPESKTGEERNQDPGGSTSSAAHTLSRGFMCDRRDDSNAVPSSNDHMTVVDINHPRWNSMTPEEQTDLLRWALETGRRLRF
ncbi:unnamed protein product [Amoebophrya sp. A120]|nr:unnamed protein product [Amoebophrya sp. A120]|eukprot:GSA120T00004577001.1